jgi:hypothetical protein
MRNEFIVRLTPSVPEPMITDDDYMDDALAVIPDPDEIPMIVDPRYDLHIAASSHILFSKNEVPVIPTEDRIAAIKHKRDRLRQMGVSQNDYIALNSKTSNPMGGMGGMSGKPGNLSSGINFVPTGSTATTQSDSTLVREDEDDEEEEIEYDGYGGGSRLQFGDPTKMKPKRATVDSEDEEDDDHKVTRKWEDNLLKKVGIKNVVKDGNVIDISKLTEKVKNFDF